MPAPDLQTARVPGFILFTADDYRTTAQACRIAAVQAEADAAKQTNPSIVKGFNATAKQFRDLAQKYELAARVL
jgi:hypothetical protein